VQNTLSELCGSGDGDVLTPATVLMMCKGVSVPKEWWLKKTDAEGKALLKQLRSLENTTSTRRSWLTRDDFGRYLADGSNSSSVRITDPKGKLIPNQSLHGKNVFSSAKEVHNTYYQPGIKVVDFERSERVFVLSKKEPMFALGIVRDIQAREGIRDLIHRACTHMVREIEESNFQSGETLGENLALLYYAMTLVAAMTWRSTTTQGSLPAAELQDCMNKLESTIGGVLKVTAVKELQSIYARRSTLSEIKDFSATALESKGMAQQVPTWLKYATHIPTGEKLMVVNVNEASKELQFKMEVTGFRTDPNLTTSVKNSPGWNWERTSQDLLTAVLQRTEQFGRDQRAYGDPRRDAFEGEQQFYNVEDLKIELFGPDCEERKRVKLITGANPALSS
jgi:hypothetical protein